MAIDLQDLQRKREEIQKSIKRSPTAYGGGDVTPSTKDASLSRSLSEVNRRINALKSEELRKRWYGADTEEDRYKRKEEPSHGFFMDAITHLQRPLGAVVGAGQYALGKGTESSLTKNINKAMGSTLTSGDVLQQYDVPRGLQIPLGFALDVMLDPINWATVGTAALIPRVGTGLVKGGLKSGVRGALTAGKTGLTSGLERKAATSLGLVPFAKKSARYKEFAEKVGTRAVKGAEKYDELMGRDVYDKLGKGIFGQPSGWIGGTLKGAIEKIPKGEKILDTFVYSPKEFAKMTALKDKINRLARDEGIILTRTEEGSHFKEISDYRSLDAKVSIPDKAGEIMEDNLRKADGTIKDSYAGYNKVYDSKENAMELLETASEDYNLKHLTQAYKETKIGTTGVEWYDNVVARLKNTTASDIFKGRLGKAVMKDVEEDSKVLLKSVSTWKNIKPSKIKLLEKVFTTNDVLLPAFKAAKVPMSVAAHMRASIGNLFMGMMMGLPVYKTAYIDEVFKGSQLIRGKLTPQGIVDMMLDDIKPLMNLADDNPTLFKQVTGINADDMLSKIRQDQVISKTLSISEHMDKSIKYARTIGDDVAKSAEAQGKIGVKRQVADFEDELGKTVEFVEKVPEAEKQMLAHGRKFKAPSEKTVEAIEKAPLRRTEEYSSYVAGEMTGSEVFNNFRREIAKRAKSAKNPMEKVGFETINTFFNWMPNFYEHIDQSYKLGTTNFLSKIGVTEDELIKISRQVEIANDDILEPVIKEGKKLYRLKPSKAGEVALETYMNYAAMPDFVRVMRSLPILGSPFLSFPYAMAAKNAKTLVHNPSYFNKVGFMINEINAGRTPEERMALENKYNEYLNSPTVIKLGGLLNTDLENLVPHFTMNMLNPSERDYDDSLQGKFLKSLDNVPVLKHPGGQVFKDYIIQSWLLSGTDMAPEGQFGQPLYPAYDKEGRKTDVGFGTKAFYAGRTLAESMIPGSFAYLGVPAGVLPHEAIDYIPSYGIRAIANATQGRSSVGIQTKEDAMRKTLRAISGRTGFPLYNLDPTRTKIED